MLVAGWLVLTLGAAGPQDGEHPGHLWESRWNSNGESGDPSTSASSSTDSLAWPTSSGMSSSGLTYQEHIAWMSAAWDEEVSLAAQLEYWQEDDKDVPDYMHCPPYPEELPAPFLVRLGRAAEETDAPDWLETVRDKRQLRRRGLHNCGNATDAEGDVRGVVAPSSLSSSTASWTTSTSPSQSLPTSSTSGSSSSSSSSFSSSAPPTSSLQSVPAAGEDDLQEGIIVRWGVPRPGRDRWHNLNGSLRKKRQGDPSLETVPEEPLREAERDQEGEVPEDPFQVVDTQVGMEENVIKAVTFYGEPFEVRAGRGPLTTWNHDDSTTAGEDTNNESATSSGDTNDTLTVGFWRHGEWVNRPRTAEEQRQHEGGRGMRRSMKRDARMQSYFRGEWKPKWRRDYIAQRELTTLNGPAAPAVNHENSPGPQAEGDGGDPLRAPPRCVPLQVVPPPFVTAMEERSSEPTGDMVEGISEPVDEPSPEPYSETGWWEPGTWEKWSQTSTNESTHTGDTGPNPWADLGWWDPAEWENWWNWNGMTSSWRSSSSSSTTSSTSSQGLPNFGLGPDVFPAHPPLEQNMVLTNAEIASLEEAAVPQRTIHRLESMMEMMDRHQHQGVGPESRWALGCLLRRADEGVTALDMVVRVLARRLMPRGYLPIRRVPGTESGRWQMFSWARGYRDGLEYVLERHLQTGFLPVDHEIPTEAPPMRSASPQSVVASEARGSTPREAVSITEEATSTVRASSGSSRQETTSPQSLDSSWALNSNGDLTHVEPASPSEQPRGPPVPCPVTDPAEPGEVAAPETADVVDHGVHEETSGISDLDRALRGELLGLWAEPSSAVSPGTPGDADARPSGTELVVSSSTSTTSSAPLWTASLHPSCSPGVGSSGNSSFCSEGNASSSTVWSCSQVTSGTSSTTTCSSTCMWS